MKCIMRCIYCTSYKVISEKFTVVHVAAKSKPRAKWSLTAVMDWGITQGCGRVWWQLQLVTWWPCTLFQMLSGQILCVLFVLSVWWCLLAFICSQLAHTVSSAYSISVPMMCYADLTTAHMSLQLLICSNLPYRGQHRLIIH